MIADVPERLRSRNAGTGCTYLDPSTPAQARQTSECTSWHRLRASQVAAGVDQHRVVRSGVQ
jgi:hypothetical protein